MAHFQVVVFIPGGWPEMMDEGPADLRELVRLLVIVSPALIHFVALLRQGVSN